MNKPQMQYSDPTKIQIAISKLATEHGLPNSFGCSEVAAAAGFSPMHVGRIVRRVVSGSVWPVAKLDAFVRCTIREDGRIHVELVK